MTKQLIISTCGTSLLTNEIAPDLRAWLTERANARDNELSIADQNRIREHQAKRVDELERGDLNRVRRLSAELNGILGLYGGQVPADSKDHHVLLHTDTFQGRIVAEVLRDWLDGRGLSAACECAAGLTTKTVHDFSAGISSVITWCQQSLPGYQEHQYRVVFNLSGGFKSFQGFMQTLGMFYADEMVYIFENNDELIRIPRLPIALDHSLESAVRDHIQVFRRLSHPGATISRADCAKIPETFVFALGDEVELSPWGKLIWERLRKRLYAERIWDSWCPLISLSSKARETADKMSNDRYEAFNERMDDLALYLTRGLNPNRLDFKALKGKPCPPSTHEFDLWADRGAWRGFGHFEGERFIVDAIGPGRH